MFVSKIWLLPLMMATVFTTTEQTVSDCFSLIDGSLLSQLFADITPDEITECLKNLLVLNVTSEDVTFLQYQPNNNIVELTTTQNLDQINPSYDTKVITHGWTASGTDQWIQNIASSYHKTGNYNVIAVDWSGLASQNYVLAAASTQPVGILVGNFLVDLNNIISLRFDQVHLIGHSLGAHVFGFAGKTVTSSASGQKVGRVTGLDAAAPLFEILGSGPNCRLVICDASFVDSIHTTFIIGESGAYAVADFYVNGEVEQPDCESIDFIASVKCAHAASCVYFNNSITYRNLYPATSIACTNYLDYLFGACDDRATAYMGDGVSRKASGRYDITISTQSA